MSGEGEAIQARVDLMARLFLARLPVRYEKMNEALALCRLDPAADEAWTELHRLLHSLAGAAGSFGCEELGVRAKQVEQRVQLALAGRARGAADLDEIGLALAWLQGTT